MRRRSAAGAEGLACPALNSISLVVPDATLIAEAIPHIVWTASPDGRTTYFNKRGTDYTGLPAKAAYGWQWTNLIHPEDAEGARLAWAIASRRELEYEREYRLRRHDGIYRWHEFHALPLRSRDGAVRMWIGTATDIDDRKVLELLHRRTEREALHTVALLNTIQASTPVGFKMVDRDFRIVRINERLARANGLSPEEHLGRTIADVTPALWAILEGCYRRALAGEQLTNVEVSSPDAEDEGRIHHWLASYYPIRIDGEVIGVGNVVMDITARKNAEDAVERNLQAMVATMATAVEYRDPYTAGHQRRVADLAGAIAADLQVDQATVDGIKTAASIHDIGKISIPAEILSKPGRLSEPEYALIKEHAENGYNIVANIEFPWPVAEMIRQHHERLDGSGYPRGLRGDDILLGARIIAVADVVEAMSSHRPYRSGHGTSAALKQIEHDRGTLLDADAVDACCRLLRSGRFKREPTRSLLRQD